MMNMSEARAIMETAPHGFCVSFEHREGRLLRADHFPDVRAGEPPLDTEEEAWRLAAQFAAKTRGKCVNLYVVHSDTLTPVTGYKRRLLLNR